MTSRTDRGVERAPLRRHLFLLGLAAVGAALGAGVVLWGTGPGVAGSGIAPRAWLQAGLAVGAALVLGVAHVLENPQLCGAGRTAGLVMAALIASGMGMAGFGGFAGLCPDPDVVGIATVAGAAGVAVLVVAGGSAGVFLAVRGETSRP